MPTVKETSIVKAESAAPETKSDTERSIRIKYNRGKKAAGCRTVADDSKTAWKVERDMVWRQSQTRVGLDRPLAKETPREPGMHTSKRCETRESGSRIKRKYTGWYTLSVYTNC